jgi:hypothetical protein
MHILSHRTAVLMLAMLVTMTFCLDQCSPERKMRDEAERMLDPGPTVWIPDDARRYAK